MTYNFNRVFFLSALLVVYGNIYAQNDTLKILHTSDIHTVYNLDKCNPIFYNIRKRLIGADDSLKNFFRTVPEKVGADAVVITGDLIDYFEADINGEKVANQVEQFNTVIETCPVPLYLTLGNHDITSYWINEKDSTKMQTQIYADMARAEFIRNISCFENGTYYKKEYQVGKTKYHFFFLDNGASRRLGQTQLDWFNAEVEKIDNEPIVLFLHIYFQVGDVNGDGIYFKKDKPTDWPKEKDCSSGFLKTLNEQQNIKAILLGHGHSNIWEEINFPSGHKIYQIETATLYDKKSNWRLLKFTEDAIIVDKVGTNEVEIEIKSASN
jgi:DNA repair exonuclease SbcCD nuclease subunit